VRSGEVTIAILADYSKAFDTVHHQIMLRKLHELQFSKRKNLIKQYLDNRKQFRQIDENKSSLQPITYGVPQGSILSPVLFNLYVSVTKVNTRGTCLQYADDTNILRHTKPKSIAECAEQLETYLSSITIWSNANNFVFNQEKNKDHAIRNSSYVVVLSPA